MKIQEAASSGAENIHWDLLDLYAGYDDPAIAQDMQQTRDLAESFAAAYRGRVVTLDAPALAEALAKYETLTEYQWKLGAYAYLAWCTDMQNPELGRLMAKRDDHAAEVEQTLLFFELEWANAPAAVEKLLDDPRLERYRHYLLQQRLLQPHTLSEPEEKIISQLSLSGIQGWKRYYDETMSRQVYRVDGKELTDAEVIDLFYHPDRELRRKAAEALTAVFNANSHTLTYVFNMLLLDKASKDRMRSFSGWLSSRNLANQVSDETVEALINSVTARYDIVMRYYRLLKQQLGYDRLHYFDRYAPVEQEIPLVSWTEARDIVLEAFGAFDPRMADIARLFFKHSWIDAPPRKGKMGGAFCMSTTPNLHPYVMLNFTGELTQVMTMAHELGHGIHAYLAGERGILQANTPITTAEMASTFGEMLVFEHLLKQQADPAVRFSLRMKKMADTIATSFRQMSLNRFEHAMHEARRAQGELTSDQLGQLWLEAQREMFGDSLQIDDAVGSWWGQISHFVSSPGYVYGYAFGELLVWALYARYKRQPEGFADRYLEVLRAGGSDWPHEILAPLGVNLQDPAFWQEGLGLLEQFVVDMEADAG